MANVIPLSLPDLSEPSPISEAKTTLTDIGICISDVRKMKKEAVMRAAFTISSETGVVGIESATAYLKRMEDELRALRIDLMNHAAKRYVPSFLPKRGC